MRAIRTFLSLLLLVSGLVLAPPTGVTDAVAITPPPSGPLQFHFQGFENTGINPSKLWQTFTPNYGANWSVVKEPYPYHGTVARYIWGPEPNSKRTGNYGLWCSAYDTSYPGYSYNWSTYLKDTAGRAKLTLPQMSDYYSATLEFWWKLPSRGQQDTTSFGVYWGRQGTEDGNFTGWDDFMYFPLSTSWQKKTIDLNTSIPSRESGEVHFRFYNKIEPDGVIPTAGQGATIDDVAVKGYWFGPVRDLAGAASATGVELSWSKPYRAIGSTELEDRDIAYRIWSRPATGSEWTELTTSRIVDAGNQITFTDESAVPGVQYVYRVVPYEPVDHPTLPKYGEIVDLTFGLPAVGVSVSGSANPDIVQAGTSTEFRYTVTNTGEVDLTGLAVTDAYGAVPGAPASLGAGESFQLTRSAAPPSTFTNTVSVSGEGASIPVSDADDVPITVVDPAITLTAGADPPSIPAGEQTTFSYTLENTGDVTLESIYVSDTWGEVTGVPASLAVGASTTITRAVTPSATTNNQVTAGATGLGFSVTATDEATVTVYNPGVAIAAEVSPSSVVQGSSATFTYTISNTGDVELDDIAVADSWGTVASGVPATLAAGAHFQVERVVAPDASVLNEVGVTAQGLAVQVSASDSVFLQVREQNPDLEVAASVAPSTVPVGDSATFTYEITNTGNVELTDIAVSDAFGTLETGVPASLDPDQTAILERTVAPEDSVTNEVVVTALSGTAEVQASDSAYLTVTHPALDVAGTVTPDTVAQGNSATFRFTVRNTGDVTLTGLTFSDSYGAFGGLPASLAPGATFQVERGGVIEPTTFVNTGSASGVGTGRTVNASDDVTLTVTHPEISVAADVSPSAIAAGASAAYTYTVTNEGDVSLSGLTLADSFGALSSGIPASLAPDASFQVQRVAQPQDSLTNTVTAGGTGTGKAVSASDSVPLTVTHPAITVSAQVNHELSAQGTPLDFTYTITNTGDVTATDVSATDLFGTVPGEVTTLAPGESTTARSMSRTPAASGMVDVTAHASATGSTVSASSAIYVEITSPALELTVSPVTRDAVPGVETDYMAEVRNTGDVTLHNVVIEIVGQPGQQNVGTLEPGDDGYSGAVFQLTHEGSPGDAFSTEFRARGEWAPGEPHEVERDDQQTVTTTLVEDRLAGSDRIRTSVEASQRLFPGTAPALPRNVENERAVIVATGYDFPDALSASALAGAARGPVLLVKPGYVHSDVLAEITRLGATKAYIIGGTAVVSGDVETQLKQRLGFTKVTRLAGSNRYATAQIVATEVDRLVTLGGGDVDTVFLATGGDFPDALAASSLAAAMKAPVLLTKSTSLPSQTHQALVELKPARVIVCGGTAVVSAQIEGAIRGDSSYGSPTVVRLAGSNRYGTARDLVEWGRNPSGGGLEPEWGVDGLFLATGEDYPDALAGGALAGGDGTWRPLMLTRPTYLRNEAKTVINGLGNASFVTLVGGTSALSEQVRVDALNLIK